MTPLEAIVLGLVQGLTEFLPVSSSGHLLLTQEVMHVQTPGIVLEVTVHVATALSVIVYFAKDLFATIREFFVGGPGRNLALRIVLASVPAVVVYVLAKKVLDEALESSLVAAICLCVTGLVLLATRWARYREGFRPSWGHALVVGCAQAIAILPGISRSGSTIAAGLFLGDDPDRAARFSFLMSVPVILGAGLLQTKDLISGEAPLPETWKPYLLAGGAAFLSGLLAIHALVTLVAKGRLYLFAPYCLLVGAGFLVWFGVR